MACMADTCFGEAPSFWIVSKGAAAAKLPSGLGRRPSLGRVPPARNADSMSLKPVGVLPAALGQALPPLRLVVSRTPA